MLGALLLVLLFGTPGLVLLAAATGLGGGTWVWPRGVAVSLALGIALAGITTVGLGAFGAYSLAATCGIVAVSCVAVAAAAGFRLCWPRARASAVESLGFAVVAALAVALFFGRPFEMLLGERDATVYTVAGIGLARGGSLLLRDHTADRIGPDAMRRFYPVPERAAANPGAVIPQHVKYPGFYFIDADRRWIISQGLPMLPALIAVFYGALGLDGAFVTNNFIGVAAVLAVFATGSALIGPTGATLGASLLALDLIEVWASRYPVAEILFQMLLFASFAAYLHGSRLGRSLAGFLLAATLFAKVEAALILAPVLLYSLVGAARRRAPDAAFWAPFAATLLGAGLCWFFFQADYVSKAYATFASLQSRLFGRYFQWRGAWLVFALLIGTIGAALRFALQSVAVRRDLSHRIGRGLSFAVVVFVAFGLLVRPHLLGLVTGQQKTLLWLSWYVSPLVLVVGFAGVAHFLWTRSDRESLFVLGILLTLSAVFLHFTFVNLIHIYMTRRFVPAALPMVMLFFGYAVVTLGAAGAGGRRAAAVIAAVVLAGAAVQTVAARSRHVYGHREYPGLARSFTDLAHGLQDKDIVLLSDGKVRNLLGPALEFVFGLRTLVVWPPAYAKEHSTISGWIDGGMAIAALSNEQVIDQLPGAEDFEPVDHPVFSIQALDQARDRFPTAISKDSLRLNRYAAGKGSDPLYELWRRDGAAVVRALCDRSVRVLDGHPFLVRQVHADCPASGVRGKTMGYLVGNEDAKVWQETLEAYGARFVRRAVEGFVLFDEIAPRGAAGSSPMASAPWSLETSSNPSAAALAVDGRLDTRWGSRTPQRPGMSFTVGFPAPADVSWLRIRMGKFATDRARAVAIETTTDGTHWQRRPVPTRVDAVRWVAGVPEENANGDRDLWVGERALRGLRIVNLAESSRFDWSIAELEIEGKPSR